MINAEVAEAQSYAEELGISFSFILPVPLVATLCGPLRLCVLGVVDSKSLGELLLHFGCDEVQRMRYGGVQFWRFDCVARRQR